jgi:NitT/TauT family transport system permease protein/taurine transport system permease protein
MSRPTLVRLIVIVAILVVWESVRELNLIGPLLLASPSEIGAAFAKSWPQFLTAFQITLVEIVAALAIAFVLGVSVGLIAGSTVFMSMVSGPLLVSLFAVPLVTWYPLFMVWFGIGGASKIAYGVVSGFFPVAINTMNGIRNFDQQYVMYGRAIGCSPMQIVARILFPLALPSIIAGLRIGVALVIIGVIVAEMLGSLRGIGYLITSYRNLYEIGSVYLGILLSVLCALLANLGLSALERHFTRWREMQMTQ